MVLKQQTRGTSDMHDLTLTVGGCFERPIRQIKTIKKLIFKIKG